MNMFYKNGNLSLVVGAVWHTAVGVLLHCDDSKESSSEITKDDVAQQAIEAAPSDISSDSNAPLLSQPTDLLRGVDKNDKDNGDDHRSRAFAEFVESNDVIQVQTALNLMIKIIDSILAHENERKYRKIKKSSTGFNTKILRLSGGAQVMAEMGFIEDNNFFVNEYSISALTKHQNRVAEAIASLEESSIGFRSRPENSQVFEAVSSDISSESSAPPMCQPLPPDKLMNVRGTDSVSDMSSEGSCPPICQPPPSGKLMSVRDDVSDLSSESSAPPMCQHLPSGKLAIEAAPSDISSESSAPPMCQPLPSGKLMNVRDTDSVSDMSSESSCPPMKARIQKETTAECLRGMELDALSEVSSDVGSHLTGDTHRGRKAVILFDDQANVDEDAGYEGDSLLIATELNDVDAVQRILNNPSTDVNMIDELGKTGLHVASEMGCAEIVEKFLNHKNTNVHTRDKHDKSAFNVAVESGNLEVARLFFESDKIDAGRVNYSLYSACVNSNPQIVKFALEHKHVDVNWASYPSSQTALSAASQVGSLQIVEKLLEQETIEVNKARTDNGATPLLIACEGHLEIVEKLLEQKAIEVNQAKNDGATPLFMACQNGHLEIVEKLLEQKTIKVNKAMNDGTTPLFQACEKGHLEIVEKLLEQDGIEVNKAHNNGTTPLFMASQEGHLEIVEKLLRQKAIEVNKAQDNGCGPLFQACQNGHLEIVEKLLEQKGIEVNNAKNTGSTPLFMACQNGHLEIVEKLLEQKEIEANKARNTGTTPLFIACQNGHLEIVEKLLEQPEIELNIQWKTFGTELTVAAYQGHLEVVRALLEQPSTDIGKYGQGAMGSASQQKHQAIVQLLRNHVTEETQPKKQCVIS